MFNNPMCLENDNTDDLDVACVRSEAASRVLERRRHALASLESLARDLETAPQRVAIPDGTGMMCQVIGPDNYISEQIRLALRDLTE